MVSCLIHGAFLKQSYPSHNNWILTLGKTCEDVNTSLEAIREDLK